MHKTVLAALLACAHALRPPVRLAPLRTRSAARASLLLRATPADADKSVDAAIDQAAAKMASSKQIARATLPGNRRALALWRVGWLSWWCQVILTTISARRPRVRQGLSTINSHATGGGVGVGVPLRERRRHVFVDVELLDLAVGTISETGVERSFWSAEDRRRTQKALRFGAKLNLVGMALTLLAAEQVVGR